MTYLQKIQKARHCRHIRSVAGHPGSSTEKQTLLPRVCVSDQTGHSRSCDTKFLLFASWRCTSPIASILLYNKERLSKREPVRTQGVRRIPCTQSNTKQRRPKVGPPEGSCKHGGEARKEILQMSPLLSHPKDWSRLLLLWITKWVKHDPISKRTKYFPRLYIYPFSGPTFSCSGWCSSANIAFVAI